MASSHPTRLVAAGSVLLLTVVGLVAPSPTAAAATCSGLRGDVNGDGYAEVTIGEPGNDVRRGGVHVLYGQASGLVTDATGTALDDQWLVQGASGVPGSARPYDDFGLVVTLGDFDGDGCADLAAAAPGARAANDPATVKPSLGDVTILYGSPGGITTTGAQTLTMNSLLGTPLEALEQKFGSALAAADLNGDGVDDLAVGAPYTDLRGGVNPGRPGAVAVAFGSRSGLGRGSIPAALIDRSTPGVPGGVGEDTAFGSALAIGDFNGDGANELAVGAFGDDGWRGSVQILTGGSNGFRTVGGLSVDQDTAGVPGRSETDDQFGAALAAGDVTGDGRDDLAVGVPGEDKARGAVVLLKGSRRGVTGVGSQRWSQDSAGVTGTADIQDAFGVSLAMGHFDRGATVDLAVGAPADVVGSRQSGSVTLLLGRSSGLSTGGAGGSRLTADSKGIAGAARLTFGFGVGLTAASVQGPGQDNLIISAPSALTGGRFAGLVHELPRSSAGPRSSGTRTFHQALPGVIGTPVDGDSFGLSVG